jgi:hypothetical protein
MQSGRGLEVVAVMIAGLAALGAAAAAGFTAWQASISRDTEIRQLRAYLYVSHGPLLTLSPDTNIGAEIQIRHAGLTPAYKVRIAAVPEVGPYLLNQTKLGDPVAMGGISKPEYAILYGADPIKYTVAAVFPWEAMQLLKNTNPAFGENRLYLHGVIRYLDIFEIERRYEFCFAFHPDRDTAGSEHGCEQHNMPG